jgi:hypothetical protein
MIAIESGLENELKPNENLSCSILQKPEPNLEKTLKQSPFDQNNTSRLNI